MSAENDAINLSEARKKRGAASAKAKRLYEKDIANRFVERYGEDLRFVKVWNKWFLWNGVRWADDETSAVFDLAAQMCEELSREVQKGAGSLKQVGTVGGAVKFAAADRRIAATVSQWDRDPWLLGTPGGTVDLRTGELRAARRGDYITKLTTVAPLDECPRFQKFLAEIMAVRPQVENEEPEEAGSLDAEFYQKLVEIAGSESDASNNSAASLIRYLQRLFGYCLTGKVNEHALPFFHGGGRNGKGTLLELIMEAMGDYADVVAMNTLVMTRHQEHPTEIAKLRGVRLAVASETQDGARWNAARIKLLTGGDKLTARVMRGDFFNFVPTHKMIVQGNKKPSLGHVDDAMAGRLQMVPFDVLFATGVNAGSNAARKADLGLLDKLKAELPGILAWMIRGSILWQLHKLSPPQAVVKATEKYLHEMDDTQRFLDEQCTLAPNLRVARARLYEHWKMWGEINGAYIGSAKDFAARMQDRGFRLMKSGDWIFVGLCLTDEYASQRDKPAPEPDDPAKTPDYGSDAGLGLGK